MAKKPIARKSAAKKVRDDARIVKESGNVFVDLGFENPEEEATKAELMHEIGLVIKRRRLTQAAAAVLMGIAQPKVSAIMNGYIHNFSSGRLMRLLTALGQDVEIIVRAKARGRRHGSIRVVQEAVTPSSDDHATPARTRGKKPLNKRVSTRVVA